MGSPVKVGWLPDPLVPALGLQHHAAVPAGPRHDGEICVLDPLVFQPLVVHVQSFTQRNTAVHLGEKEDRQSESIDLSPPHHPFRNGLPLSVHRSGGVPRSSIVLRRA